MCLVVLSLPLVASARRLTGERWEKIIHQYWFTESGFPQWYYTDGHKLNGALEKDTMVEKCLSIKQISVRSPQVSSLFPRIWDFPHYPHGLEHQCNVNTKNKKLFLVWRDYIFVQESNKMLLDFVVLSFSFCKSIHIYGMWPFGKWSKVDSQVIW